MYIEEFFFLYIFLLRFLSKFGDLNYRVALNAKKSKYFMLKRCEPQFHTKVFNPAVE